MQNILGISLGTRLMGIAVKYDGELSDFRVRTFYGAWNSEKQREMIESVIETINRYDIQKIVVKTPKPFHCSQSINDLTNEILLLGEKLGIRIIVCTISMLIRNNKENAVHNKQSLIQSIIRKYPLHRQLADLYAKERRKHISYYVKLFEAIACTELV
ncbi:MAG: hypothetical protein WCO65_01495 [bacterium]